MTGARMAAGIAAILMGLLHGSAVIGWLDQADPDSPGRRVPVWARWAWVASALLTVIGGALVVMDSTSGLAVVTVGLALTAGLAILNGFFIHGRPTVAHHAIRITVSAAVVALAVVGT